MEQKTRQRTRDFNCCPVLGITSQCLYWLGFTHFPLWQCSLNGYSWNEMHSQRKLLWNKHWLFSFKSLWQTLCDETVKSDNDYTAVRRIQKSNRTLFRQVLGSMRLTTHHPLESRLRARWSIAPLPLYALTARTATNLRCNRLVYKVTTTGLQMVRPGKDLIAEGWTYISASCRVRRRDFDPKHNLFVAGWASCSAEDAKCRHCRSLSLFVRVWQPEQSRKLSQPWSCSFCCFYNRQTVARTGENRVISTRGKLPQAILGIGKHPKINPTFYSQDNLGTS